MLHTDFCAAVSSSGIATESAGAMLMERSVLHSLFDDGMIFRWIDGMDDDNVVYLYQLMMEGERESIKNTLRVQAEGIRMKGDAPIPESMSFFPLCSRQNP